jgi:hypothetical protein
LLVRIITGTTATESLQIPHDACKSSLSIIVAHLILSRQHQHHRTFEERSDEKVPVYAFVMKFKAYQTANLHLPMLLP